MLDKSGKNHHNYGKKLSAEAKKKLNEIHKGSSNATAIDEDIVLEIYNKYNNSNLKKKALANSYGILCMSINRIVNCKHWATRDLSGEQ